MRVSSHGLEVFDRSLAPGTPLAYTIEGDALPEAARGVVRIGQRAELDLQPGVYLVTLTHPRLGRLAKRLEIGHDEALVRFSEMIEERRSRPTALAPEGLDPEAAAAPRVEAWTGRPGAWTPDPTCPALAVADGQICPLPPVADWGRVFVLRHGEQAVAVRIPADTPRVDVVVSRSGRTRLRPAARDPQADALLDYMVGGYVVESATVRGGADARQLIDRERQSPAGAAVGAYYLLRTGEAVDVLDDYAALAHNFPLVPDFWVTWGWAQLHAGRPGVDAADAFLCAVDTGVPLYREGLELLRDGIDVLREDEATPADRREALHAALLRLSPLLRALEPDCPVTTWRCGETPDPPSRRGRTNPGP